MGTQKPHGQRWDADLLEGLPKLANEERLKAEAGDASCDSLIDRVEDAGERISFDYGELARMLLSPLGRILVIGRAFLVEHGDASLGTQ